jgi:UDP-N-acetylmuramate--alanine ligase
MKELTHIYFLGIGGIGMSALARYFNAMGKVVAGYDKTPTKLTSELEAEGIRVFYQDDVDALPAEFVKNNPQVLIVYTPAIPKDHKQYNYFLNAGHTIKKRAAVLGLITSSAYTVAIAGTHGKTTTSSLIAHILKSAGKDPSAFLGGIAQNYNTNLLLSAGLQNSSNPEPLVVVEADEYDRSFLTLFPDVAVITSMDADHLDIYGDSSSVEESFILFSRQVRSLLVLKKSIASKINASVPMRTYSVDDKAADYHAVDIKIIKGSYHFSIKHPGGTMKDLELGLPGKHNVENSVAASAVALSMGVAEEQIKAALASFKGVRRRFDYHIKKEDLVFIDDYAHHPEELKATISSAKEMYPGKRITGVFQPHLFSRTRDFADDFAKSLDLLDECILMEVYPAREMPIEGVSSQLLLDKMSSKNKSICSKDTLVNEIARRRPEVLITMGAGDIDTFVEAIKKKLSEK